MFNFVADTVNFVASVYGAKATSSTNKVDLVEFNFVASVYRVLAVINRSSISSAHKVTRVNCQGAFSWGRKHMRHWQWWPLLEA